ncbi:DNA topoisomerase [Vibrio breoganii]
MIKNFLVILESKRQSELVGNSLAKSGRFSHSRFATASTNGRLFDIDPDYIPNIDELDVLPNETPVSEDTLEFIRQEIEKYDTIVIASDNDVEGDKIAFDISRLASEKHLLRTHYSSLNTESVLQSTLDAKPYTPNLPKSYFARRIFDKALSCRSDLSRVSAPVLRGVAEGDLTTGYITIKTKTRTAIIECKGLTQLEVCELSHLANAHSEMINAQPLQLQSLTPISAQTGSEQLTAISQQLNIPPKETFNHLQSLYEKGKISYFRTDTKVLTPLEEKMLQRELRKLGLTPKPLSESHKTEKPAHNCLLAQDYSTLSKNINMLSLEEKVLNIVAVNSLKLTLRQNINNFETTTKPVASVFTNHQLKSLHDKTDVTIIRNGKRPNSLESIEDFTSRMTKSTREIHTDVSPSTRYFPLTPEQSIAKYLTDNNLARPSTLASHATKIANSYLTEEHKLNAQGKVLLRGLEKSIPDITEVSVCTSILETLQSNDLSLHESLEQALSIAGITKSKHQSKGSKDHQNTQGIDF